MIFIIFKKRSCKTTHGHRAEQPFIQF